MKSDVLFNRRNLSLKSFKVTKHEEYTEENPNNTNLTN